MGKRRRRRRRRRKRRRPDARQTSWTSLSDKTRVDHGDILLPVHKCLRTQCTGKLYHITARHPSIHRLDQQVSAASHSFGPLTTDNGPKSGILMEDFKLLNFFRSDYVENGKAVTPACEGNDPADSQVSSNALALRHGEALNPSHCICHIWRVDEMTVQW